MTSVRDESLDGSPLPSRSSPMRPIHHLLTVFAAGTVLTTGAACGGSHHVTYEPPPIPFDQPDVALRDVRLRGIGILGGALDVEMKVYNPNGYDLQSPRVNYRVLLDDVELANGFTDLSITVPSHDSAVVRLPAAFSYAGVRQAGRSLVNMGAAPYRVLGRITVGTPYGRLTFPYDRAGNFSTLNAPMPR
jgi:LEA14-like dessication related protein